MKNDNYHIEGASYIGKPRDCTAMFITNKVSRLLGNLYDADDCLVFAEEGIDVPEALLQRHRFRFCSDPQFEYAKFMNEFADEIERRNRARRYTLTPQGYYVGENVTIGKDCYIEPGCVIGHDVVIGDRAEILAGAVIKNAVIGDDFICNEGAVIGAKGFTFTSDEQGNRYRVPTLGKVEIGNFVEIGVNDNISCSSMSSCTIEDYAKLDALIHYGHDVRICKNVEVTAGSILGGFSELGEGSYVGINATLRNRVAIGKNARVSMGAVVTKSVEDGETVTGNFAVEHRRFLDELKVKNAAYDSMKASEPDGDK